MIDFENAFDSVSWAFKQKALDRFNFGPVIKRSIKIFYTSATSCVSVNGQYSKWFNVQRGVRQGDPCSPYIIFDMWWNIVCNVTLKTNKWETITISPTWLSHFNWLQHCYFVRDKADSNIKLSCSLYTFLLYQYLKSDKRAHTHTYTHARARTHARMHARTHTEL